MWRALLLAVLGVLAVGRAKAAPPSVRELDFRAYALHSWQVQTLDGRRIPFSLNVPQQIVDYEIRAARAEGRPALVKVLKSRRQGISTYVCARMQHAAQTIPGFRALSMADKADLPRQWLRRAQTWHGQQPASERPELAASNAVELYFAEQQSRYWIASAEGKTPAMGDQLEGLHASEVESYLSPAKMFADLNPAIAISNPAVLAVMESTGEMEGSYWHEAVLASIEGKDGWKLVFLPWFVSPEYARPTKLTPGDYTPEERMLVEQAAEWARGNPLHAAIADFEGIRPEQVEWRRFTIATFFAGDEEVFSCRYPATISEAFMGIGTLAFPADMVRRHKAGAREPIARFTLEHIGGKLEAMPCSAEDGPHWRLYEPLDPFAEYALGADVAEGRLSDLSDDRSERDYSAVMVLNRKTLATTALFHGRIEPDKLGKEMLKAGSHFNHAWMAPEVNAAGMAVLAQIRGYDRVMPRDGAPDQFVAPEDRPLDRLGWRTTAVTRDLLLDEYVRDCRAEPGTGYEGKLRCLCPELAREEGTFIRTRLGKREHRPGCHDDVIFAAAIAMQVHRACPLELRPVSVLPTSEDYDPEEVRERARESGIPAWILTGGSDPGLAVRNEDDDEEGEE